MNATVLAPASISSISARACSSGAIPSCWPLLSSRSRIGQALRSNGPSTASTLTNAIPAHDPISATSRRKSPIERK